MSKKWSIDFTHKSGIHYCKVTFDTYEEAHNYVVRKKIVDKIFCETFNLGEPYSE